MLHRISASEAAYAIQGAEQNLRCDGRGRLDFRPITVETGVLPQSNGSARVSLGNGATDVIASVKVEIGAPRADKPNQGRIEVSAECSPSVSPKFERRVAESVNARLSQMLDRLYGSSKLAETNDLCIIPGDCCWVVCVDIMVLDYGGNLLSAATLAAFAALQNTCVPKTTICDTADGKQDFELNDDPAAARYLDVRYCPIYVTLSQVGQDGSLFVVDASSEEDACACCSLSVAVDQLENVCGIEKEGGASVNPDLIRTTMGVSYIASSNHPAKCMHAPVFIIPFFSRQSIELHPDCSQALQCNGPGAFSREEARGRFR
jgi:exosome complex component RRP42